jgi:dihydrolipoamide dehydrogenase
MTAGLLPGVDRDLVSVLAKRLERQFQAILLNTRVVAMREEPQGMRVTLALRNADGSG